MINKDTNPWMLATVFLLGVLLGFGAGKTNIGMPTQLAYDSGAKTGGTTDSVGGTGNTGGTDIKPTLQTKPVNTYDNIEKSSDNAGHFSLGNKNATVKIAEYSDFQCPFCNRYFTNAFPKILKDYIATGKVYYTYYNYPLDIHPQAPKAAEAALCAADQNKYWEFHDLLFSNQNLWSGNANDVQFHGTLAQTLGLDTGKFNQCLESGKYASVIEKDVEVGDTKQISGTPTVFINEQRIVGAQDYYNFKKAIEDELKK